MPTTSRTGTTATWCGRIAKEYHSGVRKRCPSDKPGRVGEVCRLEAWRSALERAVRSDRTRHREESLWPWKPCRVPPMFLGWFVGCIRRFCYKFLVPGWLWASRRRGAFPLPGHPGLRIGARVALQRGPILRPAPRCPEGGPWANFLDVIPAAGSARYPGRFRLAGRPRRSPTARYAWSTG